MTIVLPVSITVIILCTLSVVSSIGQSILPVTSFIIDYWWVISIVFIAFSLLQLLILKGALKYLLLLLDIPRMASISYIVSKFARNYLFFLGDGGEALCFTPEFALNGLLVVFILAYSSLKCMEATEHTYITGSSVLLYIFGTLVSVFAVILHHII